MTHARGTFDVKLTPPPAADGEPVGRLVIDKQLHGDLEATSAGQMLAFRTETPGSAGYVAIERVTGTLHGRAGSFVLQHSGTMNRGVSELSVTVVPDSGAGELVGLTGRMTIDIVAGGEHRYGFDYALPSMAEPAAPPAPAPLEDLPGLIRRLAKRGFRLDDGQLHDCTVCGEHAVLIFVIASKMGGRDIQLCQACGAAISFRSGAGLHERVVDPDFDLRTFLG